MNKRRRSALNARAMRPSWPQISAARNGSELIAAEGGSWMHEYVFSTVDEVFGVDDDD